MAEENGHEHISPDDLESLKFLLNELEKAQYAVQSFQRHIATKYRVRNGESVDLANGGTIIRATAAGVSGTEQ